MAQLPWKNNWQPTYRITFGTREYTKADYVIPASIVSPSFAKPENNGTNIPSDALVMDNLTDPRGFTFRFESNQLASSKGSGTEFSNLSLYNLGDNEIRLLSKPNCIVIVELGFEGHVTLCYTGDVVEMTPVNRSGTVEYKIKLAAESVAMRNTMINTHYDESISEQDLIIDMVGRFPAMALGTYGLEEFKNRYKLGGRGYTGSLVTNFDKVMARNNLQYTVTNGKIVIIPFRFTGNDYDNFARTNFQLTDDIIKNVLDKTDKKGVSSDDTQAQLKQLQINTFYIPVEIGQFVTIPNDVDALKDYAGTYVVKGRRVIAESKGSAWDIVLMVESIA